MENGKQISDTGTGGENLEALKSQMEAMKSELEQLRGAKADLEKKLDDADRELLSPDYLDYLEKKKGAGVSTPPPATEAEVNFDEMTPAQIAKHFESKYKGDLQEAVKAATERMDTIEDGISKLAAQIDLTLTGMKYPEFGEVLNTPIKDRTAEQKDLVARVIRIANENPSWSTEKCFKGAKAEIREEKEMKEMAERERAEKERRTLTEKPGAVETLLQGKQLSKDEAAQAAWRASFGSKQAVD